MLHNILVSYYFPRFCQKRPR